MADDTQAAAKVAEDRRKAREAAAKTAQDTLDAQAKERAFNNSEADRRMNQTKPTPTQQEIDLARLGHPVMEKEDDGSGPDPGMLSPEDQRKLRDETDKRRASAASGSAPYKTREAAPPKPSAT